MNLNRKVNSIHPLFGVGFLVFVLVMAVISPTAADSRVAQYEKKDESMRKSNKNYSNACQLLEKKRNAKVKPARKSKRRVSKWR